MASFDSTLVDNQSLLNQSEILCQRCNQLSKGSALDPSWVIPAPQDNSYSFLCGKCNHGEPAFFHTPKSLSQLGSTVLFNLALRSGSLRKKSFQSSDIRNFLNKFQTQLGVPMKGFNFKLLMTELSAHPNLFEVSGSGYSLAKLRPEDSWESEDSHDDCGSTSTERELSRDHDDCEKASSKKHKFQWCHQCKQKHDNVFHCSKDCNKKYCAKCLQRHYDEKEAEISQDNWVCVYCRGICCCAFCRKKKAKVTNTKFESRRGKKRSLSDQSRSSSKRRKRSKDAYEVEGSASETDELSLSEGSPSHEMETDFYEADSIDYFRGEDSKLSELKYEDLNSSKESVMSQDPEDDDDECDHPDPCQTVSGPRKVIRIAEHYHWLKYELQDSPDEIHSSSLFDSRLPVLQDKTEMDVLSSPDIQDWDVFGVGCDIPQTFTVPLHTSFQFSHNNHVHPLVTSHKYFPREFKREDYLCGVV